MFRAAASGSPLFYGGFWPEAEVRSSEQEWLLCLKAALQNHQITVICIYFTRL
jgi:hypothetical protein